VAAIALFRGVGGPLVGLKVYLRLARVQTSGVTATVPVYGYLAGAHAVGLDINAAFQNVPIMILLLLCGFTAHIFGFVQNELADREADARAGTRRPKPLPAGEVSVGAAKALAATALAVGLLAAAVLSIWNNLFVLALSIMSVACAAAYNYYGKAFAGGDVLLSGSIALFVLAGAAAGGGLQSVFTQGPLLFALLGASIILLNNGLEGGFKDRGSDAAAGKKTLVLALTKMQEGPEPSFGPLRFASGLIHALILGTASLLVIFPFRSMSFEADELRYLAALGLVIAMAMLYARATRSTDRTRMLALFGAHEILAIFLLVLILLPALAWTNALLLFFGPLVLFLITNWQLYGTFSAPDV